MTNCNNQKACNFYNKSCHIHIKIIVSKLFPRTDQSSNKVTLYLILRAIYERISLKHYTHQTKTRNGVFLPKVIDYESIYRPLCSNYAMLIIY